TGSCWTWLHSISTRRRPLFRHPRDPCGRHHDEFHVETLRPCGEAPPGGGAAGGQTQQGRPCRFTSGGEAWSDCYDVLGTGVVSESRALQRLCESVASRTLVPSERLGDRSQNRGGRGRRASHGVEPL